MRAAKGHAKHRTSGAAWVAESECCQFYYQNRAIIEVQQQKDVDQQIFAVTMKKRSLVATLCQDDKVCR